MGAGLFGVSIVGSWWYVELGVLGFFGLGSVRLGVFSFRGFWRDVVFAVYLLMECETSVGRFLVFKKLKWVAW